MAAKDSLAGLQRALGGELRRRWGHIREIETKISRSEGYLRKFCNGNRSISLEVFLQVLDALGLDHRSFFSAALGSPGEPLDDLAQVESSGPVAPALAKIERASLGLAPDTGSRPPSEASGTDVAELLAGVVRCPRTEQRRRLRTARRYRTVAFAQAYLEHLDTHRYQDPKDAMKLAETVAVDFVPVLEAPLSERVALQCRALGVFASAHRALGGFATTARALRWAIELSRHHDLPEVTADSLQRAAYVLKDQGHYERSLVYLREAFEIYYDHGLEVGMARTMVDRAMMLNYLGQYEAAIRILKQALIRIDRFQDEHLVRTRIAALQFLAHAYERLDDLDATEHWLAQAIEALDPEEQSVNRARLLWSRGVLASRREDFTLAEECLREARQDLAAKENPLKEAQLSLDLVHVLLARKKVDEACELAKEMARMLVLFEGNPVAEAALIEFVKCGIEGRVTETVVRKIRSKLEEGSQQARKPAR